jgi:hypothetical protein
LGWDDPFILDENYWSNQSRLHVVLIRTRSEPRIPAAGRQGLAAAVCIVQPLGPTNIRIRHFCWGFTKYFFSLDK